MASDLSDLSDFQSVSTNPVSAKVMENQYGRIGKV
jgi:hypothetical protein